jgi:hypothetical protein
VHREAKTVQFLGVFPFPSFLQLEVEAKAGKKDKITRYADKALAHHMRQEKVFKDRLDGLITGKDKDAAPDLSPF